MSSPGMGRLVTLSGAPLTPVWIRTDLILGVGG